MTAIDATGRGDTAALHEAGAPVRVRPASPRSEGRGAVPSRRTDLEPPAFRLHRVSLTYPRGVRAIDDVTLTIPRGAHTVLVGPSGSGKTTLLGCLSGRLEPTAGVVERSGPIATIYQDLRLVSERTVLGNVLDGALGRVGLLRSMARMPRDERIAAMELVERVGLRERARMAISCLSGGERQRVAIARALMQRPSVILADEPVCSLDREHAEGIMQLLRSVCEERRITLVSVLHDEALASRYADRRYCLHAGRLAGSIAQPCDREQRSTDRTAHSAHTIVSLDQVALPARSACPSCEAQTPDDPRCLGTRAEGASAPAFPARPAWMHPGSLLLIALVVVAAYAWSVVSLGLHETSGRSAVRGISAFLGALLPGSLAEITAIPWGTLLASLVETIQMSLIGTTVGVALAYPLAALAARNTGPRFLRSVLRQALNAVRTVPSLIWALLFVAAVGFGQLAGVLALSLYSVGYLTKFFYESFENTPGRAQSALREIGASGPQIFFRAVAPASRAATLAFALFMLEYNVRSASVLGIVDAGGIGYYIKFYLDMRDFPAALACLLLIFGVVVALDAVSVRVRRSLIPE
ncbi:MAG: ATP-binding cassette domain-containing protein [Phycisphaerales bacterium]